LRPGEHGRVQGAQPLRRHHAGDQPLDRRVVGNRQRVGQRWGRVVTDAHDGGKVGDCLRDQPGQRVRSGEVGDVRVGHDNGRGLDIGRNARRFRPGGLDDSGGSSRGESLRELAARTAGDNQDRTLQRHVGGYAELGQTKPRSLPSRH
jgi:hypothetical protein